MNFKQYLLSLRNLLNKKQGYHRFILGNTGGDYDSIIGSILYAFYFTTVLKIIHLPLIDCLQQDLPIRFQIMKVLDSVSIRTDQLLYTTMIPNLYNSNHSFALYDHNFRSELQNNNIFSILDHHTYDPGNVNCSHIINHCGSTLTLLYYLYYPQSLKKFQGTELYGQYIKYFENYRPISSKQLPEDQQIIDQLIYYGMVIDSYDLSPSQVQVWNQFDKTAIETLKHKITPKFTFNDLASQKFNIQKNLKLTFIQHQKKDYKQIRYDYFVIHYSTILIHIDLFISKYFKEMEQMLPNNKINYNSVYAFMFAFPIEHQDIQRGEFKKFILFNSINKQLVDKLQEIMLQLKFIKFQDVGSWKKWTDPSGKISRKIFDKQIKAHL